MDPLVRKLLVGGEWAHVPVSRYPDAAQPCEVCGRSRRWRFVWFSVTRTVVRCLRCGLPGSTSSKRRGGDLFDVAFEE